MTYIYILLKITVLRLLCLDVAFTINVRHDVFEKRIQFFLKKVTTGG